MLRILRVLAPNPGVYTLEGTNSWVVGRQPALIIDPGPDDPSHLRSLRFEAGEVSAILLTHDHSDHAEGAAALSIVTGAPVHAFVGGNGRESLIDGQTFEAGGGRVTAVHTPGHTKDHVVFSAPSVGALFTGDAVLGRGTSVIAPPEGDLVSYLRSLERMKELEPRIIYPGHGPAVFDAMAKLNEYVEHRAEREEQVVAALTSGLSTIDEMVAAIYADHPRDAWPLAARSVLANMQKLEKEGRVVRSKKGGLERYEAIEPRECERCGRPALGRAPLCGRCSLIALQEGPAS
ncbi:MAG: MBL fold metallo-hydrolase [Actinomycetota bacterium]